MILLLKAIDNFRANQERRARERAAIAQETAANVAEARAEGRAEIIETIRAPLMERGINVDELLHDDAPTEGERWLFP